MKFQVLISALSKEPAELVKRMNLDAPAVLVNQCDRAGKEEIEYCGHPVRIVSMTERGVGLSRNTALKEAEGEYILFSDDDIVYDEGLEKKVLKGFQDNPEADVLLFNVRVEESRRTYWNTGTKRVGRLNCGRFPAYSIAAKRESLIKSGVQFSLLFGGGAKYSNGEDSLFLTDCLRAGLKLYTSSEVLGEEIAESSTWFFGFNEKFFRDRGVLFAFLYKGFAPLWAFRFVYLKKDIESGEIGKQKAWKLIREGIKEGNRARKCSST